MPTPVLSPKPIREYDHILSGDITITKVSNGCKIVFSKKNISKLLMYQTWVSTSDALNGNRKVVEVEAKDWVKAFFRKNALQHAVPYTPTTVMELGNKKYVFVINNAKVNKLGHVVFKVSSEDIDKNNTNKTVKQLKKIPLGEFNNARFDIDRRARITSVHILRD